MKKIIYLLTLQLSLSFSVFTYAQVSNELLFGVAYYDEYRPYERLDKDIAMMKASGINFVRIAESNL